MEDNKSSIPMRREAHLVFLGFTAYDAIHIITAILVLIAAYVKKEGHYELVAAGAIAELIFAFLLIGFVDALVEHQDNLAGFRRNYCFAWMVASSSLLAPLAFSIPEMHEEGGSLIAIHWVMTGISLLALILYFVALLLSDNHTGRKWRWLLMFTSSLFCAVAIIGIVYRSIELAEGFSFVGLMELISMFAPLFPGAMTIWRMSKKGEASPLYD